MHHSHPILGEEHPNHKEVGDADADADVAGVEEEAGATAWHLRHNHHSNMDEEQEAYHHLEVEATSLLWQVDSSRDASNSRDTNPTPTNGTKLEHLF